MGGGDDDELRNVIISDQNHIGLRIVTQVSRIH